MNDSELENKTEPEEETPEEELSLVSFDDYITSLETEKDEAVKELEITDVETQDVKEGIVFHLKQLKAGIEQTDFLRAFQEKFNLKEFLARAEETFDRFLVDLAIFQETNFELLQTIQKEEDVTFFPEAFDFIFLPPEEFEKQLLKKQKLKLQEFLRETKNTELVLPDNILEKERNKPLVRKDIITVKDELGRGDMRLKKIKKVAPGLKDVVERFETQRIVQISMLIYYYYRLSNEDVEIDKGLSKVFPEIEEAHKKLDELEKKLKKNNADNKSEETITKEDPKDEKKAVEEKTKKKVTGSRKPS